jgi:hypothetical protein
VIVPYALEPMVAGELGEGTEIDPATHPPMVSSVEYVLDAPDADDLVESFPVFLVSDAVATRLLDASLTGFDLAEARVVPSPEYRAAYGDVPHKAYRWLRPGRDPADDVWLSDDHRLCVSDRMMQLLEQGDLGNCEAARL